MKFVNNMSMSVRWLVIFGLNKLLSECRQIEQSCGWRYANRDRPLLVECLSLIVKGLIVQIFVWSSVQVFYLLLLVVVLLHLMSLLLYSLWKISQLKLKLLHQHSYSVKIIMYVKKRDICLLPLSKLLNYLDILRYFSKN